MIVRIYRYTIQRKSGDLRYQRRSQRLRRTVLKDACFSFIGGGGENNVCADSYHSMIAGGNINAITGSCSVITGGYKHQVNSDFAFVGGGCLNQVNSDFAVVGGGYFNQANGLNSFVGAGDTNLVTGNCSAILGGFNNDDGGNDYTGIFGTGITASPIPSGTGAFWVNELILNSIPAGTAGGGGVIMPPIGYPSGSIFYFPDAFGNKVVYVI